MRKALLSACALLLVAAVPASAHVTIQPGESTTGAFARFVVRVPNEHETAATIKVEVQMPAELGEVRYQPKQGWTRTVNGRTVVWEGGRIAPGEFDEFGFSTRMPEKAGELVFPSLQTYDNGEVVSWTGPAEADKPAGRVVVRQADGATGGHGATTPPTTEAAATGDGGDGGDSTNTLAVVALIGSGLALIVALASARASRRS